MEYAWNMNDISFEDERNMNDISMEYEWKISLCLHLWQPSNNAKSKKPGHDDENVIELPSWTYILICLDSFWWLLLSVINRITIMITSAKYQIPPHDWPQKMKLVVYSIKVGKD